METVDHLHAKSARRQGLGCELDVSQPSSINPETRFISDVSQGKIEPLIFGIIFPQAGPCGYDPRAASRIDMQIPCFLTLR
jgi:hypothetical protein